MRGSDLESVVPPPPVSDDERGVPVYAIEGLLLGVLEIAWVVFPPRMVASLLADELLLMPLGAASLCNAVVCSLVAPNTRALGAFASLSLTLTIAYLWIWLDSSFSQPVSKLFFSGVLLPQIPGAVTLAFMSVHSLLALASIHRRPWRQTLWLEGSLCLLSVLFSLLCIKSGVFEPAVPILMLTACLCAAVAYAEVTESWPEVFYILYLAVSLALVITCIIAGLATTLAPVGFPLVVAGVGLLLVFRIVQRYRLKRGSPARVAPSREAPADMVRADLVHASPHSNARPQPPQSTPILHQRVHGGAVFSPPIAFCAPTPRAEAVLFGTPTRILRQQNKKAM